MNHLNHNFGTTTDEPKEKPVEKDESSDDTLNFFERFLIERREIRKNKLERLSQSERNARKAIANAFKHPKDKFKYGKS